MRPNRGSGSPVKAQLIDTLLRQSLQYPEMLSLPGEKTKYCLYAYFPHCLFGSTIIPTNINPLEPTPITLRASSELLHPGACVGQKVSLGAKVYSFSSSGLNDHIWT